MRCRTRVTLTGGKFEKSREAGSLSSLPPLVDLSPALAVLGLSISRGRRRARAEGLIRIMTCSQANAFGRCLQLFKIRSLTRKALNVLIFWAF